MYYHLSRTYYNLAPLAWTILTGGKGLFKQLPERMKGVGVTAPPPKKRHATSQHPVSEVRSTCSDPERISTPILPKSSVTQAKHPSTSPRSNIQARKRASLPQDSSIFRRGPISGIETDLRRVPNGIYSPSHIDSTGLQTPESAMGQSRSNIPNTLSSVSPTVASNGFPDVSAMMFPSADPFAYPNQPMTTLENRNMIKCEDGFDANMYDLANTTMMGRAYDNLNAQIYGPLPPYLMQGQQLGAALQSASPPLDINYMITDPNLMAVNDGSDGWAPHLVRNGETQAMELNQVLGEYWNNGWMNQGYGA